MFCKDHEVAPILQSPAAKYNFKTDPKLSGQYERWPYQERYKDWTGTGKTSKVI